jgi:hypothetical protein
MNVLPGDSILVIDRRGRRASIYNSGLGFIRSIPLAAAFTPFVVASWPDRVIGNGIRNTPEAFGLPLHVISYGREQMTVRKSFGPENRDGLPGQSPALLFMPMSGTKDGSVWAADRFRYRLSKWSADGRLLSQLVRRSQWFPNAVDGDQSAIGNPTTPPPTVVRSIHTDSSNLIWVLINVGSANWKSAWTGVRAGAAEAGRAAVRDDLLYDSIVEVIDPVSARVIARREFPGFLMSLLAPARAAKYSVDADGFPVISVMNMRLLGR